MRGFRREGVFLVLGILLGCRGTPPAPEGRIECLRDRYGVPHVFAATDRGAMFGLGWVTARDRGFQMYYKLRIAQGRLAELVGIRRHGRRRMTTLDNDRRMRIFGFARKAEEAARLLDPETRTLLQAYADGVNAWFRRPGSRKGLFETYGLDPEPWTPASCILSWWYLGQFFATDGTRDFLAWRNRGRTRLAGRKPEAPAPDDSAAVVRREDVSEEWIREVGDFLRSKGYGSPPSEEGGEPGPKFSHAWVVGARRSATGSTLLVSDPQTKVTNPSLFFEYHVKGRTFDARGIGVPGCPMILIGFTDRVAWGVTALGADQADLFRLKTDPRHPDRYFFDGKWRPFVRRTERIRIKGRKPVELEVLETRFGPVVNSLAFAGPGAPLLALKRVPLSDLRNPTLRAGFGMMRARDAAAFLDAARGWRFPSANLLFGDRAGRIGYTLVAAIPVRSPLSPAGGRYPQDGSASRFDWRGFLPPELLPHVLDPKRGALYSANHLPVGSFYPADLGIATGSKGHSLRSWRLAERLEGGGRLGPAEVFGIHFDCVNPARRELVRLALHCRDLGLPLSPETGMALLLLEDWFANGASSDLRIEGAALATRIPLRFRAGNTPLALRHGGGLSGLTRWLRGVRRRIAKDPRAPVREEERRYVDEGLAEAWNSALEAYGEDFRRWRDLALEAVKRRPLPYFQSLEGFPGLGPARDLRTPGLFCVDGSTIQS